MRRVCLGQTIHLAPGAARQVRVRVASDSSVEEQPCKSEVGIVVPTEEVLAGRYCDFQECLWRGETG